MFKVIHYETQEIRTVFGITGTLFLMFDEKLDAWVYEPMHKYRPVEDLQCKVKKNG